MCPLCELDPALHAGQEEAGDDAPAKTPASEPTEPPQIRQRLLEDMGHC